MSTLLNYQEVEPSAPPTKEQMYAFFERARQFNVGDEFELVRFPKTTACEAWTEPISGKIQKIEEAEAFGGGAFATIKIKGLGSRIVCIG